MKQKLNQEPVVKPVQTEQRKFGQGAVGAAFRQGFSELTNALKAFPDSLPLVEQPGQLNNVPPQAVSQQAGFSLAPNEYRNAHIQSIETAAASQSQSQPEMVTSHGVAQPSKSGIVDQHLERLQNTPEPSVQQELSK